MSHTPTLAERIAKAQSRLDAAPINSLVEIDADLMPYMRKPNHPRQIADPLRDEMLEMLRELEWCVPIEHYTSFCDDPPEPDGPLPSCPACEQYEYVGHLSDCRLAALIAKAEGK